MCQFIETIRYEDGEFHNLKYHQNRFEKTVRTFDLDIETNLESYLYKDELSDDKLYKYRILYNRKSLSIYTEEYIKKSINSLKLVESDLDYSFKYSNRDRINKLLSKKDNCDDILISKNGLITDTSYCNVALLNSESWFTPRSPLLKGTMRNKLVEERIILEKDILVDDLSKYSKIALFNAMIPWYNKICISMSDIHN